MGWDYEVEEVREVRMVSKEDAKQEFIDDMERFGVKKAISTMVKKMEIAELVRNEKPEKRMWFVSLANKNSDIPLSKSAKANGSWAEYDPETNTLIVEKPGE